MRTTLTLLLCSSLLPALAAQGQQTEAQSSKPAWRKETGNDRRDARNFRKVQVDGETVAQNVRKLRKELRWHKTIGGALQSARQSGKLVLWIQALGELDGFL